jgi:hypothetical protein
LRCAASSAHLEIYGGFAFLKVGVAAIFVGPWTPKAVLFVGLSEIQPTSMFVGHTSNSN